MNLQKKAAVVMKIDMMRYIIKIITLRTLLCVSYF